MTHIVSVIATQQKRIRCLLSQFLSKKKIERFQNGSVIKISVNRDNISIKLVYSGELDENKENDQMITGAGLILFWPALFFIGGTKEQEAEYARLKGEYEALDKVAIQKNCLVR